LQSIKGKVERFRAEELVGANVGLDDIRVGWVVCEKLVQVILSAVTDPNVEGLAVVWAT
jgi:hypothetical protein